MVDNQTDIHSGFPSPDRPYYVEIKSLFQKAWTVVTNPGQDERVQAITQAIHLGFREQKQAFNLDKILEAIECTTKDVEVATLRYYESFVGRHWTSGVPDNKQLQMVAWVASRLKLKPQDVELVNLRAAETAFGARLAGALADGIITDAELEELGSIASFAKTPYQHSLSNVGRIKLSACFARCSSRPQKPAICPQNLV